jgi:hypothetical protein
MVHLEAADATDEARSVTKKHYREVVTKEDVEKFWKGCIAA